MGMAESRNDASRQLVLHGHFRVNGKKANIPSMLLKVGDVITLREESRKSEKDQGSLSRVLISNLSQVAQRLIARATVKELPKRDDVDFPFEEHLIVELYSK